jgi:tetratricopeptide (TPR) repeat protein
LVWKKDLNTSIFKNFKIIFEENMLTKRTFVITGFFSICMLMVACSSQEYTTAKLAIQQSDFTKAAEWLPKAMAVEPNNPEIPMVMAIEIHAEKGAWLDMVDLFEKAMDINPDQVIEVRGSFIQVKEAVSNYTDFYWAKEFNLGVEEFKKIQEDPDNKPDYIENAIEYFNNAIDINPADEKTHVTLARCYADKGDKEAAKGAVLDAVAINPESFEANFSAAQILGRAGMTSKEILPYYEKATSIEPSNSRALRELAGIYYDLNQKERSIEVFENAIANEEDKIIKADLYFNLGVIHNQMGNYEGAEISFDEAFFLNEDDFEAALGMAMAYKGLGDKYLDGTEEGFEKDLNKAARWFRKAEKKIKDVMIIDVDNKETYQKDLKLIRYKRDIAEGNN